MPKQPYSYVAAILVLAAATRQLAHLDSPDFFLGLSSDFFAGICVGFTILCAVGLIVGLAKPRTSVAP